MIGMIEPSVIAESRIRAFKVEDEKEFKDIGKRLDAELAVSQLRIMSRI